MLDQLAVSPLAGLPPSWIRMYKVYVLTVSTLNGSAPEMSSYYAPIVCRSSLRLLFTPLKWSPFLLLSFLRFFDQRGKAGVKPLSWGGGSDPFFKDVACTLYMVIKYDTVGEGKFWGFSMTGIHSGVVNGLRE